MSSDDAIYFINHMLDYAEEIKPVLEISRPVLSRYRNKLKITLSLNSLMKENIMWLLKS